MYDFIVVLRNGENCLGETARVTGQYLIYWLEALGETRVYWGKPLVHLDLYQPAPGGPRAAVLVQAKIIRVTSSPLPRPTLLVLCPFPISHRAHPHPHPHPPPPAFIIPVLQNSRSVGPSSRYWNGTHHQHHHHQPSLETSY